MYAKNCLFSKKRLLQNHIAKGSLFQVARHDGHVLKTLQYCIDYSIEIFLKITHGWAYLASFGQPVCSAPEPKLAVDC